MQEYLMDEDIDDMSVPLSPVDSVNSPKDNSGFITNFDNMADLVSNMFALPLDELGSFIAENIEIGEDFGMDFYKPEREYKIYEANSKSNDYMYISAQIPTYPLLTYANYASVVFEQSCDSTNGYQTVINYLFKQFAVSKAVEEEQYFFKIFENMSTIHDTLYFPDIQTILSVFINLGFYGIDIYITQQFVDVSNQLKADKRKVPSREHLGLNILPNKLGALLDLITFLTDNNFQHKNSLKGLDIMIYLFIVSLDKTVYEHKSLQINFTICFQALLKNTPFNCFNETYTELLKHLFHIVKIHPERVLHLFAILPNIERAMKIKRSIAFACMQLILKSEMTYEIDPTDEMLYTLLNASPRCIFRSDSIKFIITMIETLMPSPTPEPIEQALRRDIFHSMTLLFKACETKKHLYRLQSLEKRLSPPINDNYTFNNYPPLV